MSYLFLKLSSLSSTLPLVSPLFNILFTQTYRNNERNKNKKKKNENLEKKKITIRKMKRPVTDHLKLENFPIFHICSTIAVLSH